MANIELTKTAAWTRDNKIHFNEQKSETISISRRKRKERRCVMIYLNSRPLPQVQSLKYLGIIIDKKLTFKDHLHYITDKCSKHLCTIQNCQIKLGLGHGALKTIYTNAILPLLQYGAPIWIKALAKDSCKIKLIRAQRLINIRRAKSFRTVSNEALCIINGLTQTSN